MTRQAKAGGIAALIEAACYIFGFAMIATVLNPDGASDWSHEQKLAFVLQHKDLYQWWNIVIYVVFGVALVVLVTALHKLMRAGSSFSMAVATPFGLIWAGLVIASGMVANVGMEVVSDLYAVSAAEAARSWATIGAVQDGLGGGVEVVGGLWMLLLSLAAVRHGVIIPRPLGYFGLIVGLSGIVTIVPGLSGFGAVFGLTQILWFVAIGVVLLRLGPVQVDLKRTA